MKTNFYHTCLLALLSLSASFPMLGQAPVAGKVSGQGGVPIESAVVTLHRAADSLAVKFEFTDAQGAFRFEQAARGEYRISASRVGMMAAWSPAFPVEEGAVEVPAITLLENPASTLKEVTVERRRPLFERLGDRTVVNVEGSIMAAGQNSLDVLQRSPGIRIDNNENLSMRGRQGVLVIVDGKRIPMSGTELADYLKSLQSDQIKSIELIHNPPAKYDAQGNAGIIAINLKKDQRLGTNGTVTTTFGQGGLARQGDFGDEGWRNCQKYTAGLSLNHRRRGLNLFGSYNAADRTAFHNLDIHRWFYSPTPGGGPAKYDYLVGQTDQINSSQFHSISHSGRAGADVNLGKNTVVGAVATAMRNNLYQTGLNRTTQFVPVRDPATGRITGLDQNAFYRSDNLKHFISPNYSANLNLRHTLQTKTGPAELTADLDWAGFDTDRDQDLFTDSVQPERPVALLRGVQKGELTIQSAKADLVLPFSKELKLESGVKASQVSSDNDVVFTNAQENTATPDLGKTNRFFYDENIYAAYTTLTYSTAKTTLSAGLRGEVTRAKGRQAIGDTGFTRAYQQIFPTASIRQALSEKHQVSFSLGRRIDRPNYNDLNPFRSYIDATTYGQGNTELLPQTTYNLEAAHTFLDRFTTSFTWAITNNANVNTVQPEAFGSRIVKSTSANLKRQDYYGVNFSAEFNPVKAWTVNANALGYYNRFMGDVAGTSLNKGRATYNLNVNNTFTLGKGWQAQVFADYQGWEQYGFMKVRPLGRVEGGVQKSLWDRKGTLRLNVTDAFYTGLTRATSTYDGYTEFFFQRGDYRVVTVSFSYRFGNDKLAPVRRRAGGAEDEKRRAA